MKLKKKDKVKIVVGKDRGKTGEIDRVYSKQGKILIPGLNLYKKHVKKSDQAPQGGVVEVPRAIGASNVIFICPKCGKAAKLGYQVVKGKKSRICKKCKSKV
jgi:large subunit ribosomal protein L24